RPHEPLRDLRRHGVVGLGARPREPDRVGVAAEVRRALRAVAEVGLEDAPHLRGELAHQVVGEELDQPAAGHDASAWRPRADAALRAIVEGVESETGEQFFASLVKHLASALRAQYAFVSELSDDRKRFRTRALWGRGAFLPDIDVPLAGTPCEGVLNGQMSHFPERLQELFPADRALGDWGVHSYCGVPLVDPAGVVVGHLAICDDEPMWDGPRGLSVMRI